jgi:hypothetical protein
VTKLYCFSAPDFSQFSIYYVPRRHGSCAVQKLSVLLCAHHSFTNDVPGTYSTPKTRKREEEEIPPPLFGIIRTVRGVDHFDD